MTKEEVYDVEDMDLIEEAYERVDVLVKLLEKKKILNKGEYESALNDFLDNKYEKELE